MRRPKCYKLIPAPEQLAAKFLAGVNAAAGKFFIRGLGEPAESRRCREAQHALVAFIESLKRRRKFGDFRGWRRNSEGLRQHETDRTAAG